MHLLCHPCWPCSSCEFSDLMIENTLHGQHVERTGVGSLLWCLTHRLECAGFRLPLEELAEVQLWRDAEADARRGS